MGYSSPIINGFIVNINGLLDHDRLIWFSDKFADHVFCKSPLTGNCAKLELFSQYQVRQPHVLALKRAVVLGDEGAVCDRYLRLYLPSILTASKSLISCSVMSIRKSNAVRTNVDGTIGLLLHHGPRNISHFIGDGIGRIWQLFQSGQNIDVWVIPDDAPVWYEQFLKIIGINNTKIIKARKNSVIRADRVLVPSPSGFAPMISPWILTAINDLLSPKRYGISNQRFWVSRKYQKRNWINEEFAKELLVQRGFQFVYPEFMSIEEQINMFSDSKIIAGPHGSGLFWALVSQNRGGLIFEVSNEGLVHPDLHSAANIMSWEFGRTPADDVDLISDPINEPITSSVKSVVKSLDMAIKLWSSSR